MLWQFPVSMLLFALVNLGVFSKYSAFFFRHPSRIVVSVAVAYVLSVVYYLAGFFLALREESAQRLAAGVSLAILNNVLVIVFASEFFGPLAATVAAMYMFPYYTMIVPAKLAAARIQKVTAHG
jgi:BASS family bile acid:Na+ symporter